MGAKKMDWKRSQRKRRGLTVVVQVDDGEASLAALPFREDDIGVVEADAADEVEVAAGDGHGGGAGVLKPEGRRERAVFSASQQPQHPSDWLFEANNTESRVMSSLATYRPSPADLAKRAARLKKRLASQEQGAPSAVIHRPWIPVPSPHSAAQGRASIKVFTWNASVDSSRLPMCP
jgi:hypothetical protein